MSDTKGCGCGCMEKSRREPILQNVQSITVPRKKKSAEKKKK